MAARTGLDRGQACSPHVFAQAALSYVGGGTGACARFTLPLAADDGARLEGSRTLCALVSVPTVLYQRRLIHSEQFTDDQSHRIRL